ncbi:type II secretion system minor pseudopilin GspI [Marinimicrobium sp. C2-29]|uniref:type II secretion system minor pseudopilin GspI n=1 Tax=Marinimicrobium sp. C2-29 TaxID=3139825 RepID=UPI0031393309
MVSRVRQNRGFTLVEVMVALVIVAVALPAFLSLVMTQLDGTGAIRDKTMAFWVAENEMTRLQLQHRLLQDFNLPDSDQGEVTQAGVQWYWQMENEATDSGIQGFRQVEISVALDRNRDSSLAQLLGFVHEQP